MLNKPEVYFAIVALFAGGTLLLLFGNKFAAFIRSLMGNPAFGYGGWALTVRGRAVLPALIGVTSIVAALVFSVMLLAGL
ncbi:MAG: hypothetical protein WA966_14560 [Ornithinimicrobium sp.]